MSPLASYRRLFELAGTTYVVVAFLARLPLAMSQLGTLLLVSDATGSYGLGGLAAGALAVANAAGAPFAGALADRIGQRHVVLVQSLAGAGALVALVALVRGGAADAAVVATAALAGLAMPQVGPLARVRWRPITAPTGVHQRRLVDVAFSYEGAADEASFAIGPALVGVGVAVVSPGGALLLAAAMLAIFGTAFALHRSARRVRRDGIPLPTGRLLTPVLLVLVVAQLLIGSLFGATQTGTTVLATQAGVPGAAGLVHAVLGVGSAVAGVATAFLPERIGPERRMLGAAAALSVLSLPLLLVDGLAALVPVVLLLGCAVAPLMIAVFSLAERVVAPARVATAMTLLASATGLGYAVGSGTAGRLADAHGHTAAFAVTVTAMVLELLLVLAAQRRLRTALVEVRVPVAVRAA
ncbi:MFS transporter [Nocardioides lianchengensis]|uniref:Major Facilitator Superfamily protein n=1 Tax=Nocardioides lianchengensis TaxID=1045774 RepID=A0A1G7A7Q3_9ACTN|nr:MFS transporter [Nocardioides lianchengensis]NYG13684.1 MFS family permease [Nocardioides lianchengensis]SDE10791.1 Major Facilitator Superfamily protein [Nocardioides lianchengensis]